MSDTTQVLCPDGKHRNFHKGHIGSVVDPTSGECVEHWQGYVFAQNKRVYGIVVIGTSCFTPHGKNADLVQGTFALPDTIDAETAAILADGEALDAIEEAESELVHASNNSGADHESVRHHDPFALAAAVD